MFESKTTQFTQQRPLIATLELQQHLTSAAQYRLQRVCKSLQDDGCDAVLLYNPINIRYATESSNMQVWTMHNAERYALVFADGYVILWDFTNCEHLTQGNQQIDEVRSCVSSSFFATGNRSMERAKVWAQEIDAELRNRVGGNAKLAIDIVLHQGAALLQECQHTLMDGEAMMGRAKLIKSDREIALMQYTIDVAEKGIWRMHKELKPGMTENEIWAYLHFENIKHGGEWIETRLLSSGPRTNPWMRESSNRVMREGELLSFDTDLVGPFGYCADISRCWTVGETKPTDYQRELYTFAYEQLHENQALLKPGLSYSEFSQQAWQIPERFYKNRYCCIAHGVGMVDENPAIAHAGEDWQKVGYDGVFEENMVVCVESYIGDDGGAEGVKLEQQLLVTKDGCKALSKFPFEQEWLS